MGTSWQRRLRDLVLAGGAVAAASACSSDGLLGGAGGTSCCNANPDPCCPVLYCGAPMTPACSCQQDGGSWDYSRSTCGPAQAPDAGSADGSTDAAAPRDGSVPDADAAAPRDASPGDADAATSPDASLLDAGPTDSAADAPVEASFPPPFCCNANPDPCCTFEYCGAAMTPACASQIDGGGWACDADGGCHATDAGPGDAGGDAHD
jgi:hypothetical protein